MTLYAADSIDDAFAATRQFLLPFSLGRWAKLALVALFIGTGTGAPTTDFNASAPGDGSDVDFDPSTALPDDVLLVAAILVGAAVLLGLVWGIVGSIMEFVFVESLRSGDVTLRRYWGRWWRAGLRLFGFRLALGVAALALVGGWLALVLVPLLTGGDPAGSIALFVLALPLVIALSLAIAAVNQFTTVFVVPIMIQTDAGVLAAWRQLWPSIRAEWKQYLAYILFGIALTIGAGLVVGMILGVALIAVLVPLGGIALLLFLTGSLSSTAGLVALGLVVVAFLAVMAVAWAFVQVPVVTYLRYYALLVLGDIEPSFDLIPDRRAAIRSGGPRR